MQVHSCAGYWSLSSWSCLLRPFPRHVDLPGSARMNVHRSAKVYSLRYNLVVAMQSRPHEQLFSHFLKWNRPPRGCYWARDKLWRSVSVAMTLPLGLLRIWVYVCSLEGAKANFWFILCVDDLQRVVFSQLLHIWLVSQFCFYITFFLLTYWTKNSHSPRETLPTPFLWVSFRFSTCV